MPIATPIYPELYGGAQWAHRFVESYTWKPTDGIPVFRTVCEHCGAPIQTAYYGISDVLSWSHLYPGPWAGSKICDPQQARAAQQGKAPSHA